MKVVCIDNQVVYHNLYYQNVYLTIGKCYVVYSEGSTGNTFCITDDRDIKDWYSKVRFKLLSEVRNEKLNELLDGM